MSTHVNIYFQYESRVICVTLKASVVDEISLSMVEGRILKKLGLDGKNVKLDLSYDPRIPGCEHNVVIHDDDDMLGYLTTIDKDNRRSLLNVEVISTSEQMSRVGNSLVGTNYEDEIGPNALTLYVEKDLRTDEFEAMETNDDDRYGPNVHSNPETGFETETGVEEGMDRLGMEYVEQPIYLEPSQVIEEWDDGLNIRVGQEFPNRRYISEMVDRAAFVKSYGYTIKKSDLVRWVVKCDKPNCGWRIRAAKVKNSEIFSIRTYTKMHTCSRASQSTSNDKRKGSARLVASVLNEDFAGIMETPRPKVIKDIVKRKLGVEVSYSTALRGKNMCVSDLHGTPEDSYKMLHQWLYMLKLLNPGTKGDVAVDEEGKFKYLFFALGACIEGFRAMRKVIIVDATFLKNGYGGVLVFATGQDPNRHNYPLAVAVLDGENNASWYWFFKMLSDAIPDSPELVFMSDRNASLISAVSVVYPMAHHGHCLWHLAQNVKTHTSNVNKDTVAARFMEVSRHYTVAEFERAYESFRKRYPTAYNYVEQSTVKEKWARCYFEGERYNVDTSNSAESMNSAFDKERSYSLIPMLDAILRKFSEWFNDHRKDAGCASERSKLVPFVENYLHDIFAVADKLLVHEINSYLLDYEVVGDDGRNYLVNLQTKSCSCRMFDIEKYPCLHGLAAYLFLKKRNRDDACSGRGHHIEIELYQLASVYFWTETWVLLYNRSIYVVPDKSSWTCPHYIKALEIKPKDRLETRGRKKKKRMPSVGERRPRTQNKRRKRQNFGIYNMLFGSCSGE